MLGLPRTHPQAMTMPAAAADINNHQPAITLQLRSTTAWLSIIAVGRPAGSQLLTAAVAGVCMCGGGRYLMCSSLRTSHGRVPTSRASNRPARPLVHIGTASCIPATKKGHVRRLGPYMVCPRHLNPR